MERVFKLTWRVADGNSNGARVIRREHSKSKPVYANLYAVAAYSGLIDHCRRMRAYARIKGESVVWEGLDIRREKMQVKKLCKACSYRPQALRPFPDTEGSVS